MNADSNNTKLLRCNSFRIRLGGRTAFHVFALGIISLLNACATTPNVTPVRIPDLTYQDKDQSAYIWTFGLRMSGLFNRPDYAIIIRIDDVNIPDKYLTKGGNFFNISWLLEIPAGEHIVEILYREETLLCFEYACATYEVSRQTLTFIAEPNRTYTPFTSDECSIYNFWIEDWGLYVPGSKTERYGSNRTDFTKPVVAGEAPTKNSCE